ncbi:MAG: helix-turn-helix domain-containing protein, partial [Acidimicrobiales bacterium]
MSQATADRLPEMPEPWGLRLVERDGEVFVFRGPHLFANYDKDDLGMRNLAVVALTDAGFSGIDVASCFSLSRVYVSMLRSRARDAGSEGLVRTRGRKKSLSPTKWARALKLSDNGASDSEIARRFGVHSGTVGRRLGELRASRGETSQSPLSMPDPGEGSEDSVHDSAPAPSTGEESQSDESARAEEEAVRDGPLEGSEPPRHRAGSEPNLLPRIGTGEVASRYAGAMLLHPF